MRTWVFVVLAGCGSSPPRHVEPERPQEDVQPLHKVVLELVRRPPVGTAWHEADSYETDSQGTRHHTRHQLLESDVTVVAQTTEQETLDITITKHESTRDGADDPALIAPGTKLRVLRQPGACKVALADGTPVSRGAYQHFTDAFDCNLPANSLEGDDVLFAVSEPRAIGSTWQMAQKSLAEVIPGPIEHALVTLARVDHVDGREVYILDAGFTAPEIEMTFHHVVPLDDKLPLLRSESVMKSTHAGAVGTYTTTRTRTPRR